MIAPTPASMGVYRGSERIGEIEDHGQLCVLAFVGAVRSRVPLGMFADRKAAMLAGFDAIGRPEPPQP